MRRDFALPEEDMDWLEGLGRPFELVKDGGLMRVLLKDWPVPEGYNLKQVEINVRIEPGYPDSQIDMAYFCPSLARRDGREIRALSEEIFDGRMWQRWSRHRTPANPWRPGIDSLATHFALIDDWLARELRED